MAEIYSFTKLFCQLLLIQQINSGKHSCYMVLTLKSGMENEVSSVA